MSIFSDPNQFEGTFVWDEDRQEFVEAEDISEDDYEGNEYLDYPDYVDNPEDDYMYDMSDKWLEEGIQEENNRKFIRNAKNNLYY